MEQTRRTREEWAALIGTFERSSQSVNDFCEAKRIAPKTFRWWRWQLRSTSSPVRRSERVQLLPVSVTREIASNGIALRFSGIEMRVEVGTDVAYVADLVTSLRSRC